MTSLLKTSSCNHNFDKEQCVNCKKDYDCLFWELIEKEDDKALHFMYIIHSQGADYQEGIKRIVKERHVECLTDDEVLIKDIIL